MNLHPFSPHRYCNNSHNREVSLNVITYENPYVVRAGERGQPSYVNLSTDFRGKAVSYVGSSVGLFEIFFFAFSAFVHGNVQAARNTRYTHRTPRAKYKKGNAVSVHVAYGGRMQPTRLQSNNACLVVVEKSRRPKPNISDFLRMKIPCSFYVIFIRNSVERNLPNMSVSREAFPCMQIGCLLCELLMNSGRGTSSHGRALA